MNICSPSRPCLLSKEIFLEVFRNEGGTFIRRVETVELVESDWFTVTTHNIPVEKESRDSNRQVGPTGTGTIRRHKHKYTGTGKIR